LLIDCTSRSKTVPYQVPFLRISELQIIAAIKAAHSTIRNAENQKLGARLKFHAPLSAREDNIKPAEEH
jgi:hypothetical protein